MSYVATMNDGSTLIRTARKTHHCEGGHNGSERTRCPRPFQSIEKGQRYVEYLGESYSYQSGSRYHLKCAEQQGLVTQSGEQR